MRLRDFFRSQPNHERKFTSSIIPVLDTNTFINAALDKDTSTLHKYLLSDQPDPITKVTALHNAVETANLRAIQLLLQAGAQVNVCDASLSTPLHIAAYMGYEEIVQILLTHGADVFLQDDTGRSAFHLAVSTGNHRLIHHFLYGIETEPNIIHVQDAQNWTALMMACASNHPSVCTLLLTHGADMNCVNNRGMNVFHIAAFLGSLALVHELMNCSTDDETLAQVLNQGDNRNQTPLFYACLEGHLDVAVTFLHAGANAYHLDNEHQTCLHAMLSSSVILKRHIRLFFRLIQYVDFHFAQDNLSRTLLDLAYLNQIHTIIYLLTILNYKRNYAILSHNDYDDNHSTSSVLSLRQLCVLAFKRSIVYHQNQKQLSQHDLLENALQQTFHVSPNNELQSIEPGHRKSLDDLSIGNKKSLKTTKKSRKTSTIIYSSMQNDLEQQHTQSTWSIFNKKFKLQRLSNYPNSSSNQPQVLPLTDEGHVMKNLALFILVSPSKIDELLDFPSLGTMQHLLDEDIKSAINNYNLEGTDSSNEI
ncbi:unnamed protein product [Adineta ricciae]|uniref:Uncharacterized protein n=1 Tax=Adineta ricciae TaxID=249248 RepID=A0A814PVH1_ADIRI|nr:unnamed protein product [Adineta ricciae]